MKRNRRVALLIETANTYGREILEGVAKYQRSHAWWSTYLDERELGAAPPQWLLERSWDGIICRSTHRELAQAIGRKRIPTIDLNDLHDDLGLPRIQSDMVEIGRMAARHLFERGFRNFAFCGFSNEKWSEQRQQGFKKQLAVYQCDVVSYQSPWRGESARHWHIEQDQLVGWLASLPKPVGIMACNDVRGQHVLNACQTAGLYAPEQVAVIGVDNDQLLCNSCNPPLSSVQPNPKRIGFEAAQVLEQLMDGKKVPSTIRLIEPVEVVVRQSTDALGIQDATVVAAISLIREAACHGLSVPELIKRIGVPRSSLERKFRRSIGHSPQQEIRLTQLARIKELLRETELSLADVATQAGFAHTEYMTVVFKRMTGIPPSHFREMLQ